jgi:hypothetical protein
MAFGFGVLLVLSFVVGGAGSISAGLRARARFGPTGFELEVERASSEPELKSGRALRRSRSERRLADGDLGR